MKLRLAILCIITFLSMHVLCEAAHKPGLHTVRYADKKRYMGTWFEIAKLPHWFEKNLVGTTATFKPLSDDKVAVVISGYKKDFKGKRKNSKFEARIVDRKTNAKIVVNIFLFFTGTFYVIELDPAYDYAVVGNEARDKVWILSRKPRMDPALYGKLLRRIQRNGFDASKIEKTKQKSGRTASASAY